MCSYNKPNLQTLQVYSMMNWDEALPSSDTLVDIICGAYDSRKSPTRCIVAISGVPGSGKTTLSKTIVEKLNQKLGKNVCKLVSQDGFHLYRSQLAALPNSEEAVKLRGAPFTFDSKKFVEAVRQIKLNVEGTIDLPDFSHSLKDPIEGAIVIGPETKIIILEGNYVNLANDNWREISEYTDQKWMVTSSEDTIRCRLIKRHLQAGICANISEAAIRVEENDLQNARYIMLHSVTPDLVISN